MRRPGKESSRLEIGPGPYQGRQGGMPDSSTLAFHLTYATTIGMAFVMLLGQFLAFTILLSMAAVARVLACDILAIIRRFH